MCRVSARRLQKLVPRGRKSGASEEWSFFCAAFQPGGYGSWFHAAVVLVFPFLYRSLVQGLWKPGSHVCKSGGCPPLLYPTAGRDVEFSVNSSILCRVSVWRLRELVPRGGEAPALPLLSPSGMSPSAPGRRRPPLPRRTAGPAGPRRWKRRPARRQYPQKRGKSAAKGFQPGRRSAGAGRSLSLIHI